MRIATLRVDGGTRAARLDGDEWVELDAADVGEWLRGGRAARETGRRHALAGISLAPLVPRPPKILCLGLNYLSHVRETGREAPEYPTLFAKFARSLVGARDPIVLPRVSEQVDWEVELGFVIGEEVRHADRARAERAIAGYTVVNDVSVRDWQFRTSQFLQGKTFEKTTPLGPALVTPDEVDGARDLVVRCEVDGEVMQEGRTSDLLFAPIDIVVYVSRMITLEPGDVVSTGTPGGVGVARKPPVFLRPGQVMRTSIEGLGELVNECVAEGG